ncbi:MAG: ATP-binding cassette domain-containing protein, partial [Acholeplasma sp.]|nr:ATP-binding cassette domain-containing protein [Acholeplasma sp.]
MLKISNLQKRYGDKVVIEDFNFELKPKTIFGLVGINGAGKSTLLRLIAGVVVPDSGEIIFDNTDVLSNPEGKKHMFFLSDDPY